LDKVSIAFRLSVPRVPQAPTIHLPQKVTSPLPFGFLSPGFSWRKPTLSFRRGVTIAFRLSVPRVPQKEAFLSALGLRHHCLSAFCPPGSAEIELEYIKAAHRHHCLSAFCPPGSATINAGFEMRLTSPLPFGFLSPGFRLSLSGDSGTWRWSPLPFGFLSPGFDSLGQRVSDSLRRHHCLSAFCPPGSSKCKQE